MCEKKIITRKVTSFFSEFFSSTISDLIAGWVLIAYAWFSSTVTKTYESVLRWPARIFIWYYNRKNSGIDLRFEVDGVSANVHKAVYGSSIPEKLSHMNEIRYTDCTAWMKFFLAFYDPTFSNLRFFHQLFHKNMAPIHIVYMENKWHGLRICSIDLHKRRNITKQIELYDTDLIIGGSTSEYF